MRGGCGIARANSLSSYSAALSFRDMIAVFEDPSHEMIHVWYQIVGHMEDATAVLLLWLLCQQNIAVSQEPTPPSPIQNQRPRCHCPCWCGF